MITKRHLVPWRLFFDEETGPLADYAETLAILIVHYEEQNFPLEKKQGVEVLKFLMEQNGLKQRDLVGTLGGKSTVSEILNGKKAIKLAAHQDLGR